MLAVAGIMADPAARETLKRVADLYEALAITTERRDAGLAVDPEPKSAP
jgi:hypothetical protein